jgi:CBS domain-containing protein
MRVSDLMTRNPVCCQFTDNCSVAAKLMWDFDCGAIPVVGEGGAVKGIVTDRDICMACQMRNCSPNSLPVGEAMSHSLYTCAPTSSVSDAERIMRTKRVRRLPVLDSQQRLVGILSLADIAREAERERTHWLKDIPREEVTDVLGDICQPWKPSEVRGH